MKLKVHSYGELSWDLMKKNLFDKVCKMLRNFINGSGNFVRNQRKSDQFVSAS